MPVKRKTLRSAVDYFSSLENEESGNKNSFEASDDEVRLSGDNDGSQGNASFDDGQVDVLFGSDKVFSESENGDSHQVRL